MNSKQKGKRGELDLAHTLNDLFPGINARRGQQFKGTEDSPDVETDVPWLHIECKRTEKFNLYDAMDQACKDCGDKIPVVFHRRNGREWVAIVRLKDIPSIGAQQWGRTTPSGSDS